MANSHFSASPHLPRTVPTCLSGRQRLRLALRDAARAAYCQMYYWGRDVMHPDGNLLVRYGFEKFPRTTKEGTSRYRLGWEKGLLELHGFCAGWYATDGPGICFDRKHDTWRTWHDAVPPDPAAMQAGHFRRAGEPEHLPLLAEVSAHFFRWLLHYEVWAVRQWSLTARQEQHRDFVKLRSHRWWLPPDLSLHWLAAYTKDPASVPRPKSYLQKT